MIIKMNEKIKSSVTWIKKLIQVKDIKNTNVTLVSYKKIIKKLEEIRKDVSLYNFNKDNNSSKRILQKENKLCETPFCRNQTESLNQRNMMSSFQNCHFMSKLNYFDDGGILFALLQQLKKKS